MRRLNLVDESHKVLGELSDTRKEFKAGKFDTNEAKQYIGFFNSTARIIGTAIHAEKWYKQKNKKAMK